MPDPPLDPRLEGVPPDDPAMHPERQEEDLLLNQPQPELAFNLDPFGRLRKLRDLFFAPRRLFRELLYAPDIMTPFLVLTVLGCIYVLTAGERAYNLVLPEALAQMEIAQRGADFQVAPEEAAQFPSMMATGYVWGRAAFGFIHLTLAGMYALLFWGLARYLGFMPYDYAQCLSLMSFIWLPKPLYGLLLDFVLPFLPSATTWGELEQLRMKCVPGMHLLIPDTAINVESIGGLALFYLVLPLDIFLIWALVLIGLAGPTILRNPPGTWKLVAVYAVLFVILSAGAQRFKMPPEQLRFAVELKQAFATTPVGPPYVPEK